MQNEELIKALRQCRENGNCDTCEYNTGDNADCIDTMMAEAADELERLTAENAALREAARWIPVSERLPEVEQSVLCIDDEGTPHVAKNWVDWEDGSISFEVSDLNCWIKCAHWMPFPDPPRKDDEV